MLGQNENIVKTFKECFQKLLGILIEIKINDCIDNNEWYKNHCGLIKITFMLRNSTGNLFLTQKSHAFLMRYNSACINFTIHQLSTVAIGLKMPNKDRRRKLQEKELHKASKRCKP